MARELEGVGQFQTSVLCPRMVHVRSVRQWRQGVKLMSFYNLPSSPYKWFALTFCLFSQGTSLVNLPLRPLFLEIVSSRYILRV